MAIDRPGAGIARAEPKPAGRHLREKGLSMNLVKASGLTPKEFAKMQKAVVTLRNNLIKAAQDQ